MTIPRATPIPCSGCSTGDLGQGAKGDEWVARGGGGEGVGGGGGIINKCHAFIYLRVMSFGNLHEYHHRGESLI